MLLMANSRDEIPINIPVTAYDLLFNRSEGDLMVCSAAQHSASEGFAFGNPSVGGFFTSALMQSIHTAPMATPAEQRAIWENVLQQTVLKTNQLCRVEGKSEQTPYVCQPCANRGGTAQRTRSSLH